jgi:hypothetical protein
MSFFFQLMMFIFYNVFWRNMWILVLKKSENVYNLYKCFLCNFTHHIGLDIHLLLI